MINLFKKKAFLSNLQQNRIVQSIQNAENKTSGEIRLYMETNCKTATALQSAMAVFTAYKMNETANRNGVLLYIATKDKKVAIYGDKGIHEIVGQHFWDNTLLIVKDSFKKGNFEQGIIEAIENIGDKLCSFFPKQQNDINELSDEIIFGK